MAVLENCEPKRVFHYFEEICKIPHGSGNTKQISDYLVQFAKDHDLKYVQDEMNNVVIYKPGTAGYENAPVVIIQGHMDMVCEKRPDVEHDFTKDGLNLSVEGDYVSANGTTLGGDDGIAVAYGLALLESDTIAHPPLEVFITVDEEIGLLGAVGFDCSVLKGRRFINLDSEAEGSLWISCAGGLSGISHIPVQRVEGEGEKVQVKVCGLMGGHSGAEIQKQLGNAHKIMGRVLYALAKDYDFNIVSTNGGNAANVIAQYNTTEIIADPAQAQDIIDAVAGLEQTIYAEFAGQEPTLSLKAVSDGETTLKAFDADTTSHVIGFLYGAIDGVQCYDRAFPTAVESSLNTGIVETTEDTVKIKFQVRSSVATKLDDMRNKLDLATDLAGASREISGEYPAWSYNADSVIRPKAIELYKEMFGKEPTVETTHGGLECGILYGKKNDLDIISFGPELTGVHTYNERVHIESTKRMWDYLKELLKICK